MSDVTLTGEVLDLGAVSKPLLIFSGPCSNAEATQAVLDIARREGFAPDEVICTGDIAAYCASPSETTDAIRDFGCHVVLGNCEESLGDGADDCGCGFEEGTSCDLLSVSWYRHALSSLSAAQRAWMRDLPHHIMFTMNGHRVRVVHGSPATINEFVFPATPERDKARLLSDATADVIVGGHSGIPFTQNIGDAVWHNSGIIGIPANDGTPRVWYSTISPEGDGLRFQHHPLDYDHVAAAQRIFDCPTLPPDYAQTLLSGLWPSDDVMPPADRSNRGVRLEPQDVVWPAR